jgi:uncharacterized membrane protein
MRDEGGAAAPLMLAVAGLVMLLGIGVADAGLLIAGRYQAAVAADAAALAAAPVTFRPFGASGTPRQEAARFAARNGASLIGCRCASDPSWQTRTVEVVVTRKVRLIGGGAFTVRASSRAEFAPIELLEK